MTDPDGQIKLVGIDPLDDKCFFVRKRDGRNEEFNEARIHLAIESAFKAVTGIGPDSPLPPATQSTINKMTDAVAETVLSKAIKGEPLEVERIQDAVEEELIRDGHVQVVRRYILYREERRRARAGREKRSVELPAAASNLTAPSQTANSGEPPSLRSCVATACRGLEDRCSPDDLIREVLLHGHADMTEPEVEHALEAAAASRATMAPAYDTIAARLLLKKIYRQALPKSLEHAGAGAACRQYFSACISEATYLRLLAPELAEFDLEFLAAHLQVERDDQFCASGLRALHDHFLLRDGARRIETPQFFWMRLAMGLALNEGKRAEERALEFYEALSSFAFVPSAPMLFNAGTPHPHLTACHRASGWNDLEHVTLQPGGRMSRHQRTGLTCSWLEPWHAGMNDFLARARPGEEPWQHDLNKGAWIPDLFMKRLREKGRWTLFDPAEVPDLHSLFGRAFEQRYLQYEEQAAAGQIKEFKEIEAATLWREILASLAQTGQPWLAFKDAVNLRSPQDHTGVVRNAQLCAGILLNSSPDTPAVCSVGAVNLAAHIEDNGLDLKRLSQTVSIAIRILDNALDLSAYPTPAAQAGSQEHRPVALGLTGFQEALYQLQLSYAGAAAADFAGFSMEAISQYAIMASAALAQERGPCPSHAGSKWSRGVLPADTLTHLEEHRGLPVNVDRSASLDWTSVRETIQRHGLRHSVLTAIAPALEGSAIAGVTPSIEPAGRVLFAGADAQRGAWNLHLVTELRRLNLWDDDMRKQLRQNEHSLQSNPRIPPELKEIYRTAFEIEPRRLIACAARRQKWIDMGQTLTLYATDLAPEALSELYLEAWEQGLKTIGQLRREAPACRKNQPQDLRQTPAFLAKTTAP